MKILGIPVDFRPSVNGLVPVDEKLYSLAMDYCNRELASKIDLRDYRKVWVSVVLDRDGLPTEVTGVQCLNQVIDLPVSRYKDSKAAKVLSERVESYMQDNGLRGASVFVYLSSSETPEQKCRNWGEWLRVWRAKPADRWEVRVR